MPYIFITLTLFAFACNNNTTPPPSPAEEVPETPAKPQAVVDQEPEDYFRAAGSNADWNLELKSAMNGTFPLTLIQNNGQDTLFVVLHKFMDDINGKPAGGAREVKFTGVIESSDKGEAVAVSLTPGDCTDKSGIKHPFNCKVTIDKKTLKGCGGYID